MRLLPLFGDALTARPKSRGGPTGVMTHQGEAATDSCASRRARARAGRPVTRRQLDARPPGLPGAGSLKIQAVLRSVVWLVIEGIGHQPVRLEARDIAVFAGDRSYTLSSDPALPPVDALPLLKASTESFLHTVDAAGRDTVTIGGHIDLNTTGRDLLLSALPPLMHVRATTAEAPAACWLMDQPLREMRSDAPGATFAADHLAQLLFVQVLRAFPTDANSDSYPTGWRRALADERIAPALRLTHGDPAHPGTLPELARAAAMSAPASRSPSRR
ncbi:cupin domain-containing protein [Streptomyces sp. NPDC090741]|uniref:cupin domain-containing protein n=1 Tax=Streptomyces sp. NPDC090741 TaxID=3365967 RepID=UPI00380BA962